MLVIRSILGNYNYASIKRLSFISLLPLCRIIKYCKKTETTMSYSVGILFVSSIGIHVFGFFYEGSVECE
jgi:hypothetical protein